MLIIDKISPKFLGTDFKTETEVKGHDFRQYVSKKKLCSAGRLIQ